MGPGLAYATSTPSHLLNVPVGRMSAFPEDPEHFLRWMRRVEPATAPGDFVPRMRYGQYLESLLRECRRNASPGVVLESIRGEAVDISQEGDTVRVTLAEGLVLEARRVVLALGNARPADLPVEEGGLFSSPQYVRSPWERGALDDIEPHHSVLLVGTGLTMVDTALSLAERNHEGRIHALSRHGLLPQVHREGVQPIPPPDFPAPRSLRGVFRALRRHIESQPAGTDWRGVVDGLRPLTASLWGGLSVPSRRRFLRHARALWDTHRHRMAPSVAETLTQLRRAGVLHVHAGRLRGFQLQEEGWVEVRARPRGVVFEATLRVQHVINCTGPDCSMVRGHPLLCALLESGLARLDALGIGLATDEEGGLLDAGGRTSSLLSTLGPLRRGSLWESTAIPEIRAQAAVLARRLRLDLASHQGLFDAGDVHPLV